ncbi:MULTISPECIES: hypothetical protein [Halocynthiibacter]|uniref:AlgX/AlgJ SGNH hydrolase-like domain-containing protein n=1 Tax=Halocynthiibacter halioticoli TaxID=2986804 RepID=A0AAE3LSC9_9RHOB|nr:MULTISPECIES: hypothetical protein [Halocynthiibacter]MCV6825434.1 hypothetical protein [Halocynthiibacter halioticoli]MCW4058435.1 hypothetical protein [Halocynthiibacter sp. SDUM655004]
MFSPNSRLAIGVFFLSIISALFAFEALLTMRTIKGVYNLVGYMGENGETPESVKKGLPPAYTTKAINRVLGVERLQDAMLGGVPFEQVMLCSNGHQPITYSADRYGFNNPDTIYENAIDVMVIGDSFIEGICLPPGDDIVGQLRQHIPASASFGSRGTGPLFHLAVLGRYGRELKPPHTIFAFFEGNDWENLKREKTFPYLKEALDADSDFGETQLSPQMQEAANSVIERWWAETTGGTAEVLSRNSVLRNFLALQKTAGQLGIHYPRAATEQPIYNEIIKAAKGLVNEWDGELSILYIPAADRYAGLFDSGFAFNQHKLVSIAAEEAGVPVIDLSEVFKATEDPFSLYALDSHFSRAGASLGAKTVAEYLTTERTK